jgi:hypothetical protein
MEHRVKSLNISFSGEETNLPVCGAVQFVFYHVTEWKVFCLSDVTRFSLDPFNEYFAMHLSYFDQFTEAYRGYGLYRTGSGRALYNTVMNIWVP